MFRFILPSLLCVLTLGACSGPVEDTRPGQPVKHRQDAFKAMLRSFEPMGVMLRTHSYRADEFARLANELNSLPSFFVSLQGKYHSLFNCHNLLAIFHCTD